MAFRPSLVNGLALVSMHHVNFIYMARLKLFQTIIVIKLHKSLDYSVSLNNEGCIKTELKAVRTCKDASRVVRAV